MTSSIHGNVPGTDSTRLHPPFVASEAAPSPTKAYLGWFKPSTGEVWIRNAADSAWVAIVAGTVSDAELAAIAALVSAANKIIRFTGSGAADLLDFDTDATLAAASATRVPSQSAVKAYIDGLITGLSWKQAVRVATTAAGALASDFENGDTVDGVVLATGDRILIKNQAAATENGIYIVAASGAPARASDANAAAELVNATVYVSEGTANADTQWTCTANAPVTIGATNLPWAQITSSGTPAAHGSTHHSGGSDPVKLDDLAPPDDNADLDATATKHGLLKKLGTAGQRLKSDGTNQQWTDEHYTIPFMIDGGAAVITTGFKGLIRCDIPGTIVEVTVLSADNLTGSIVLDLWKDTYANHPPTVADTITASAKPTISSATKATDSTLTGWTLSIAAGDEIAINVDSVTTFQRVLLSIKVKRT